MNNLLSNLPNSLKFLLAFVFFLLVFVKFGDDMIDLSPKTETPELQETQKTPEVEEIVVRLNIRDDTNQEALSDVKVELISLGGSAITYTDSGGYADIKIPKKSTVKIYLRKSKFKNANYQIDPDLNIPKDRNITYYLVPEDITEGATLDSALVSATTVPTPLTQPSTSGELQKLPTEPETPQKALQESRPSPKQFMRNYYANINNKKIAEAWRMLTEQFQNNHSYSEFQAWWGNKVEQVNIQEILLIEENNETATVEVRIEYLIKGEIKNQKPLRYILLWNANIGNWQIHRGQEV